MTQVAIGHSILIPQREQSDKPPTTRLEIRVVGVEDRRPSDYGLAESEDCWKTGDGGSRWDSCAVERQKKAKIGLVRERKGSRVLVQGNDGKVYGKRAGYRDRKIRCLARLIS